MQIYKRTYEVYTTDEMENIELYKPGGIHPVTVGDVLNHGRYRLVHKLGCVRIDRMARPRHAL
jgi:serine/threonine-protein kinase SRPK3